MRRPAEFRVGGWTQEEVYSTRKDVHNILCCLGIYDELRSYSTYYPMEIDEMRYQSASVFGLWYPEKKPGDLIKAGEFLGCTRDYEGNILEKSYSDLNGVILYQVASLQVLKDGPMIAYGKFSSRKDERKEKILKAIIQNYLETGEPVGSRTISKYSDLKLSSATIRNEMSDLEELGYIIQPHTSAGRIPSDKGYRFYVDQLIHEKETEVTQVRDMVIQRVDRVELLLKQMAKLLASNTNYATLISGPQYHQTKIKFIQLSRVETGKLLIVTVLEGNIIKNSIVTLDAELTDEDILNLNILLNSGLNGLTMEQINLDVITRMKGQAGERSHIVDVVLSEVAEAIRSGEEDLQIYTEGTTNIFKYPELSDGAKASQLIGTLEQKDLWREILTEDDADSDKKNEIQVYIGSETQVQSMKDCSIVTANYELGDGLRGTIGIVGPKRMDYDKVVSTLRSLKSQLDQTFNHKDTE